MHDYVEPSDMLAELREDNKSLAARLREAHNVCDEHRDIATASLIEVWIDETERRTWFLYEAGRRGDSGRTLKAATRTAPAARCPCAGVAPPRSARRHPPLALNPKSLLPL